jgi:hypothetical protein
MLKKIFISFSLLLSLISRQIAYSQNAVLTFLNNPINTNSNDRSICSFVDGNEFYELRLQKSGLNQEAFIPVLEIRKNGSDKIKSISVNLGAGKFNEQLQLASARYESGHIYLLLLGDVAPGVYNFYTGKLNKEGELKGNVNLLKMSNNAVNNKGTPYVVTSSFGVGSGVFSLLLFAFGAETPETRRLVFNGVEKLELGVLAFNQKFEMINSDILTIQSKSEGIKINQVYLAAEGDLLLSVQTGTEKKAKSWIYHTHIYRLNTLKKEELSLRPASTKRVLIKERANELCLAWCEQNEASDPVKIWVQQYEKGEFKKVREHNFNLAYSEREDLKLPSRGRNFDLIHLETKPEGVFIMGAFFEQKENTVKKGKIALPDTRYEYYYSLIKLSSENQVKWFNFPIFMEKSAYSPALSWEDDRIYLVYNTHYKNLIPDVKSNILLLQKDVAKNACVVAHKISIFEGTISREIVFTQKEKLRLLTAYAEISGINFNVEAITKQSAGDAYKNKVKNAMITFK